MDVVPEELHHELDTYTEPPSYLTGAPTMDLLLTIIFTVKTRLVTLLMAPHSYYFHASPKTVSSCTIINTESAPQQYMQSYSELFIAKATTFIKCLTYNLVSNVPDPSIPIITLHYLLNSSHSQNTWLPGGSVNDFSRPPRPPHSDPLKTSPTGLIDGEEIRIQILHEFRHYIFDPEQALAAAPLIEISFFTFPS